MKDFFSGRGMWIVVILMAMAGLYASQRAFSPDDSFITFRYSKHLAEGTGPVYNPGEPVEGYTNFLWMLLMAVPHMLNLSVQTFAWILGFAAHGATALIWLRIFRRQWSIPLPLSVEGGFLLVLMQATLLAFSVSGMETAFNLLLWSWAIWQYLEWLKDPDFGRGLWLGLSLGLCILSRPDGLVLPVGMALAGALELGIPTLLRRLVPVLLAFAFILLPYLLWKWMYYGTLLPNTFVSKESGAMVGNGIRYLGLFTLWTLLPVGLFLYAFSLLRRRARPDAAGGLFLILSLLWMGYVLYVGGDFMEFRMMAPVIPAMIFLWLHWGRMITLRRTWYPLPILLLLSMNVLYMVGFGKWMHTGFVVTVDQLHMETAHAEHGLIVQGKTLQVFRGLKPPVRTATGGAGAQPYYHDLYVMDMVGLNDAHVARHGIVTGGIPGHARWAHFDCVEDRGIHLLVGGWPVPADPPYPDRMKYDDPRIRGAMGDFRPEGRESPVYVLRIPIPASSFEMVTYYLKPHPGIDRLIREKGWKLSEVY